jgi:signal transduction histidine kinase
LGVVYARRERDNLTATARRDATALAVLAGVSLENPDSHDLTALASSYRTETGAEVAVYDPAGRTVVGFDAGETVVSEPDVSSLVGAALAGKASTARRRDEGRAQLVAAVPVQADGKSLGAVVVAVPAANTDSRVLRAWVGLGLFAVALLGLAALVGFLLARSLAAPLVSLQRTAKRLGGGELDARASPGGPAEIAALAEELNAMADRIRLLVEAQRRFVADASHQLRTPLTALRLRLENLAASGDPDSAGDLEAAEAESQRLARLVDGLLTLSRAEDHRRDREDVDVVGVAEDRRDMWDPLAEERGVSVVVHAHTPAAVALAVPGDLEQILDNLLSNALEASPSGAEIAIVIDGREAGRHTVVVEVRDQGPGMAPTERQHAFDRFWQGKERVGGSGLGLAIVQQLAEANGGNVSLDGADGGGLVASVTLPSR